MRRDAWIIAIMLAVAFQVQATLPLSETGIRVSVADLLLPALLGYLAVPAQRRALREVSWAVPATPLWLVAIMVAMTAALVTGYLHTGSWQTWAVANKYAGGFVLLSYFVLGSAMTHFCTPAGPQTFVTIFVRFAVLVAAINVLAMPILLDFYSLPVGVEFNRATGFMQNPNAYGFLVVVALVLYLAGGDGRKAYIAALLAALWFSASRGSLIALVAAILALGVSAPARVRPLAVGAVLAAGIIVAVTGATIAYRVFVAGDHAFGARSLGFTSEERFDPHRTTIEERRAQSLRAVEIISQNPLTGIGLGSFVAATGRPLHNSLLWLLVETGLLGTVVFSGFLMLAVWSLYRNRDGPLQLGMLGVAVAFIVISTTGEFLYQRHLWFLLGMALAKPRDESAAL